MGAIVIGGTDIFPPYIKSVYPPNGWDKVGYLSNLVFRIEDSGGSNIDLDTLEVTVDGLTVVSSGEVVTGTPWSGSKVSPWQDGIPSIVEVILEKSEAHYYSHEYSVVLNCSDNDGNLSSRTFICTVEDNPEYEGTSISDFSELEMTLIAPFSNQYAEKFRARVLYGLVPGAESGNSLEKQASRRAVQLLYRYNKNSFISQYWETEVYRPNTKMTDARSMADLSSIEGQFREACRQAISWTGRMLDQSLVSFVEGMLDDQPVAASLCLLSIMCKERDTGGLLK